MRRSWAVFKQNLSSTDKWSMYLCLGCGHFYPRGNTGKSNMKWDKFRDLPNCARACTSMFTSVSFSYAWLSVSSLLHIRTLPRIFFTSIVRVKKIDYFVTGNQRWAPLLKKVTITSLLVTGPCKKKVTVIRYSLQGHEKVTIISLLVSGPWKK